MEEVWRLPGCGCNIKRLPVPPVDLRGNELQRLGALLCCRKNKMFPKMISISSAELLCPVGTPVLKKKIFCVSSQSWFWSTLGRICRCSCPFFHVSTRSGNRHLLYYTIYLGWRYNVCHDSWICWDTCDFAIHYHDLSIIALFSPQLIFKTILNNIKH